MSGTGAFNFGAPLKATGATTSPAPPKNSIFNIKATPSLVSDSDFSQPNSTRPPTSTPQSLFSFGVTPSSAIKQESSSTSQPPVSFGRPSPASPAPQSFFSFGQSSPALAKPQSPFGFGSTKSASPVPQPSFGFGQPTTVSSTPQPVFSFGPRKSASPAPQSPFGFGQPTPASSAPPPTTATTEVALTAGLFNDNNFPSNPEASVDAGTAKRKCDEEAAGAPEDLRSAQLKLWHEKKHTDLIVTCGGCTWQCHKATLLPRCPAFQEACMVRASDGKHELKLADQKAEVVEALLIYLYTYEHPKFATVGDASIALQLGNLYSITKFAEIARSQILEGVKKFGKMGNEDIKTWVQNFELWWGPQQTAMNDIKIEALRLIVEKYEQFVWSDDFMNLLGCIKDFRIEVFRAMAVHNADKVVEQVRVSNTELQARLGEQFKNKVKKLNGTIKCKQMGLDATLKEKEALQRKLDSEGKTTSSQASVRQPLLNHTGDLFGGPHHSSRTSPPGLFGNSFSHGKF